MKNPSDEKPTRKKPKLVVVVDDDAAILEILPFGQHIGADQDVDLFLRVGGDFVGEGGQGEHRGTRMGYQPDAPARANGSPPLARRVGIV